jgi:formate/nitrite transporter FocA (FNT family)
MAKSPRSARRAKSGRARRNDPRADGAPKGITAHEVEAVEEMSTPRTPVIYEVVRRQGDEELERPAVSLWWSGLAAGLSMSFSLLAEAVLKTHLPDAPWRPLIASLGYTVGFLMTVLSRQQLFTESTITVVLPVLANFKWRHLWRLTRLWSIVLAANLIGTLVAALFCNYSLALPGELLRGMHEISRELTTLTWWDMFFRAISAGFLIAAMVWMIPTAENQQFIVIALMTWLIAVGGFTHIVAGSVEAYLLMFAGAWEWWQLILDFIVPVLLGNIVGGTVLFAVISYAQVMKEI